MTKGGEGVWTGRRIPPQDATFTPAEKTARLQTTD